MRKIILTLFLSFLSLTSLAADSKGRFFIEGDGNLSIKNNKTGVVVSGNYRNKDGSYNRAYLDSVNKLFGIPTEMGEDISLRTISFADYLQDKYAPGKTLLLLSGYRSPKFNAALHSKGRLAARTSYHLEGMAADLIFPGVDSKQMWEEARQLMYGGVGYYDGKSVHIDSGKPRFWTAATALPKKDEPPQNKNIYLSVDYDVYKPGDTIRFMFSGISEYPFGVSTKWVLKKGDHKKVIVEPTFKESKNIKDNCYMMTKRSDVRFIYWRIPTDISADKNLSVEVSFCDPTTPLMPPKIDSRPFDMSN